MNKYFEIQIHTFFTFLIQKAVNQQRVNIGIDYG